MARHNPLPTASLALEDNAELGRFDIGGNERSLPAGLQKQKDGTTICIKKEADGNGASEGAEVFVKAEPTSPVLGGKLEPFLEEALHFYDFSLHTGKCSS